MNRYLQARLRICATVVAGAIAMLFVVAPTSLHAAEASDKIRLMTEALRARDSGDLDTAKERAEALLQIAPEDQNAQQLLMSINQDLERRGAGEPAVFGQGGPTPDTAAAVAEEYVSGQDAAIAAAYNAIEESAKLAELGAYDDAQARIAAARANIELNTATAPVVADLRDASGDVILTEAETLATAGNFEAALQQVDEYVAAGGDPRVAAEYAKRYGRELNNPYNLDINAISPDYVAQQRTVNELLTRGRAQYLNGDYEGASRTFGEVEARDPNNRDAKYFQTKISEILADVHEQNFYKTRQQLLTEVDRKWDRPKVFDTQVAGIQDYREPELLKKMREINIPQVNFSNMELTRVIETLSEFSVINDPTGEGVNIVPLFDPNSSNPRVNITLRNLSLDRILEFVTQQVDFTYEVGEDAVTIARADTVGGVTNMTTEFFPITRATVVRLTGIRESGGGGGGGAIDPFAPVADTTSSGPSSSEEADALKGFFTSAGVNFDLQGASLAYDGDSLIVTQTSRNIDRMRVILRKYNEVKQVEIESKFLEVAQNDLDELGFDWSVGRNFLGEVDSFGAPVTNQFGQQQGIYRSQFTTQGRRLSSAFGIDQNESTATINNSITGQSTAVSFAPPATPQTIDIADDANSLFVATGFDVLGYNFDLAINALSRKTGSDLMSAPKVTVLSGKRATITVAQELRYPESYGDIETTASTGGGSSFTGGGNPAVSIVAGTPQDFVVRNVGVEMAVTPNVETNDTISLILEPRVTQFQGFVEYGGPSVAIAGSTTAVVPAGFYQPIFATREVTTEVTVFDGATIVLGGLTRDEIKTVNDRVPVLGDVPWVGRLFRSEGESRQKRNLLIFVTANLVSPGGSPTKQSTPTLEANSLFQDPTIVTPAGTSNRSIEDEQAAQ